MGLLGMIALGLGSIVAMGALVVGGTFFKLFTLPWLKFDTKVNMNQQVIQKTYDADNAIYNYHWFQERAGEITAEKSQREIAKQSLTDYESNLPKDHTQWTFEDKTEDSRLRAVYQGLQNNVESLVNEYNARAGEADRSMFVNGLQLFIQL